MKNAKKIKNFWIKKLMKLFHEMNLRNSFCNVFKRLRKILQDEKIQPLDLIRFLFAMGDRRQKVVSLGLLAQSRLRRCIWKMMSLNRSNIVSSKVQINKKLLNCFYKMMKYLLCYLKNCFLRQHLPEGNNLWWS